MTPSNVLCSEKIANLYGLYVNLFIKQVTEHIYHIISLSFSVTSFLRAVPDVARSLPELIPFLQLTDVFSKGIPGSKVSAHQKGSNNAWMESLFHLPSL